VFVERTLRGFGVHTTQRINKWKDRKKIGKEKKINEKKE